MRNRDLLYNVISQPSIVSSEEEKKFGFFLHAYTSSLPCWDEVEAWKDAEGRVSVLSFRKGSSSSCVLLLGHYDTVGVDDYPEKAVAFEPEKAKKWMIAEAGVPPEIRQGLEKGEWVAGRGSLDMKAGIVSQLSFVEEHCPEDVTVLCLWVPDEEGYSAGARFAFPRLFHFLQSHSLRLKWVIKSDFTHIKGAIYSGSTGKCLLNAYIRTKSGHIAGGNLAFNALFYAAEVIRYGTQFSRPDLSVTPLFLQTLPAGYTVQTPFECWVNLNMLFFRQSLQERLGIWYRRLSRQFGEGFITWVDAREKVPPKGSLRERALEIIRGKNLREGIYLFFSPPYYPPIATPKDSPVRAILLRQIRRWKKISDIPWHMYPVYPHISDLSFFQHRDENWEYFARYCPVLWEPVWENEIPAVTVLGPYGYGAHSPWECVDVEYSLNILPQVYRNLIESAQKEGFL